MSRFVWEISEANDNAATEVPGGTICLEEFKVVSSETAWDIEQRGESTAVAEQRGGEIWLNGGNTSPTTIPGPGGPDRGIVNFALVVFILLVVLLVVHGTFNGSLTFSEFIERVVYLLAGAGLNQHVKNRQPPAAGERQPGIGQ